MQKILVSLLPASLHMQTSIHVNLKEKQVRKWVLLWVGEWGAIVGWGMMTSLVVVGYSAQSNQSEMRLYDCSRQNTGSRHSPEFGFFEVCLFALLTFDCFSFVSDRVFWFGNFDSPFTSPECWGQRDSFLCPTRLVQRILLSSSRNTTTLLVVFYFLLQLASVDILCHKWHCKEWAQNKTFL